MSQPSRLLLLVAALVFPTAPAGAQETWASIRRGMTEGDVAAAVGVPLLANGARGYRHWFYDHGGAVMFSSGVVVFWSLPRDFVAQARPALAPRPPPKPAGPAPEASADRAAKTAHLRTMTELATQKPLGIPNSKNPLHTQAMPFVPVGGSIP